MNFPFPRFSGFRPGRLLRAAACLVATAFSAGAEDIVWNFGAALPGTASPVSQPANLTVGSVTQGNNNGTTDLLTTGSASSATYSGASQGVNAQMAAKNGPFVLETSSYFETTLTPAATFRVNLSDVSFGTRRTNTGPQKYNIRTSADNYATALVAGDLPAATLWGYIPNTVPTVISSAPLTIRIYGTDGSGAVVNTAVWRIDDLKLGVVLVSDGTPAPVVSDVSPLSGTAGTAVTITGTDFGNAPAVRFNGTSAPGATVNVEGTSISVNVPAGTPTGPGTVTVTTNGGVASGPQPFTVLTQPAITVVLAPDTVLENAPNPASTGTVSIPSALGQNLVVTLANNQNGALIIPPSVTIPLGQVSVNFNINVIPNPESFSDVTATITASAAGHDQGSATIKVQNTDAQPTTVVVNKYFNTGSASGDVVELLVTGNGTPGSTVDMRRMLLKDHSASMANDGGGRFRFKNDGAATALFSAVKAGTLLVLTDGGSSSDTDAADFTVRLSLTDTNYFTTEGTSDFDIAGVELIMIKGQDASADGGTGAIHSLAGGAAGTQFNSAPPKKLIASGNSGTNQCVVANNSTSTLADYDGTDATGVVPVASVTFGAPNSNSNNKFIRDLRGLAGVDGAGAASITNGTAGSPFSGKNFFPRSTPAQTVTIDLVSNVTSGAGTISIIKVTVPASFGVPVAGSVSVSGTGAGTPGVSVSGQDITITGAAVTATESAVISIAGLSTPNPTAVTDDGRYAFPVQTTSTSGVLTAINTPPVALVQIPVASLRDVDSNGLPADFNKMVAVSGVCTEENFNATGTSAYLQDGDFAINVFISGVDLGLVRGTRYAVIGPVIQFNGLTEISPGSAASVIALGPDTSPAPLTITLAALLANPEIYEGRLVRVAALNYVSGSWAPAANPPLIAGDNETPPNTFEVRIQAGSTALTPPSWPATITGIFGQFDASAPFTTGYQLMPRSDADVESSGGGTGYDGWAAAWPGIGGPSEDADSDGVSNLLEYAGGSIPDNGASQPQAIQTLIGTTLTVVWAKGAQASADPKLTWTIEAATSLTAGPWSAGDVLNVNNGPTSISGDYIILPGVPKAFLRLKVVRTP